MRKPSNKMGVAPRFRDYTGTDAAGFVASENVARRHMSISQLALAGAKLADVEMARAKARQLQSLKRGDELPSDPDGSDGDAGRTAQIVADKIGIGRTTVNRGIKVVKAGAPEVVKAVESNGMSSARILPLAAQGLKVRDGWDTPPRSGSPVRPPRHAGDSNRVIPPVTGK